MGIVIYFTVKRVDIIIIHKKTDTLYHHIMERVIIMLHIAFMVTSKKYWNSYCSSLSRCGLSDRREESFLSKNLNIWP